MIGGEESQEMILNLKHTFPVDADVFRFPDSTLKTIGSRFGEKTSQPLAEARLEGFAIRC